MGTIQTVEDLKRRQTEKEEILPPVWSCHTSSSLNLQPAGLLACSVGFRLTGPHNCLSQLLNKISLSVHVCVCASLSHTHTHTHFVVCLSLENPNIPLKLSMCRVTDVELLENNWSNWSRERKRTIKGFSDKDWKIRLFKWFKPKETMGPYRETNPLGWKKMKQMKNWDNYYL